MAKPKKNTDFGINASIGGRNVLAGKIISINLKKEAFFGVGEKIWLTPTKYWVRIPDDLTPNEYNIISACINNGTVVLGKEFIPPVDKPSDVIDEYWLEIQASGVKSTKFRKKLTQLCRRGIDRNYTIHEIITECIARENKYKKRADVIELLSEALKFSDGPLQAYDPPDTEEGLRKVIIGNDGTVIGLDANGKEVPRTVAPPSHQPGSLTAEDVLQNLLG